MRKTGIFIGLGMAISLSIFIVAGVIYYNPVIRTSLYTLEETKEKEQEPQKVEAKKVVTVEIEKPIVVPADIAVEKPAEVVLEVIEPLEPIVVEKEIDIISTVKETEIVDLEVEAREDVEEKVEEVEVVVAEPRIPPAPVMRLSVTEYVEPEIEIEVKAEKVEIFNRFLYRIEEKPIHLERDLTTFLPLKAKEKVDYIWTETTVEEGDPLFIDPIKFNELAFERHRIAVDEVLEQLNW